MIGNRGYHMLLQRSAALEEIERIACFNSRWIPRTGGLPMKHFASKVRSLASVWTFSTNRVGLCSSYSRGDIKSVTAILLPQAKNYERLAWRPVGIHIVSGSSTAPA